MPSTLHGKGAFRLYCAFVYVPDRKSSIYARWHVKSQIERCAAYVVSISASAYTAEHSGTSDDIPSRADMHNRTEAKHDCKRGKHEHNYATYHHRSLAVWRYKNP